MAHGFWLLGPGRSRMDFVFLLLFVGRPATDARKAITEIRLHLFELQQLFFSRFEVIDGPVNESLIIMYRFLVPEDLGINNNLPGNLRDWRLNLDCLLCHLWHTLSMLGSPLLHSIRDH